MTPARLILLAFSRMLDGYRMGIIPRNGYREAKTDFRIARKLVFVPKNW